MIEKMMGEFRARKNPLFYEEVFVLWCGE